MWKGTWRWPRRGARRAITRGEEGVAPAALRRPLVPVGQLSDEFFKTILDECISGKVGDVRSKIDGYSVDDQLKILTLKKIPHADGRSSISVLKSFAQYLNESNKEVMLYFVRNEWSTIDDFQEVANEIVGVIVEKLYHFDTVGSVIPKNKGGKIDAALEVVLAASFEIRGIFSLTEPEVCFIERLSACDDGREKVAKILQNPCTKYRQLERDKMKAEISRLEGAVHGQEAQISEMREEMSAMREEMRAMQDRQEQRSSGAAAQAGAGDHSPSTAVAQVDDAAAAFSALQSPAREGGGRGGRGGGDRSRRALPQVPTRREGSSGGGGNHGGW